MAWIYAVRIARGSRRLIWIFIHGIPAQTVAFHTCRRMLKLSLERECIELRPSIQRILVHLSIIPRATKWLPLQSYSFEGKKSLRGTAMMKFYKRKSLRFLKMATMRLITYVSWCQWLILHATKISWYLACMACLRGSERDCLGIFFILPRSIWHIVNFFSQTFVE